MLSKSIITPFAPKYKLFDFQKYLKVIQKPLNSHMQSFNKSGSNFSYDSLIDDSFVIKVHNSQKFIKKDNGNTIKGFSKKIILTSKKLKKSNSFVQEYQDLLTTLSKTTMKSNNNEEKSSKSFNNLSALEKIKPRLRSFLFLSNAFSSNKEPVVKQTPFIFNKLILEIRRKSCGCRECGGFCEKLQKYSNFLTEKESKTVIENHQKLRKKPKLQQNLKKSHLTPKLKRFGEEKRVSLDEKARSALLRMKRHTVASEKKNSLNLLNSSSNDLPKLFTPLRTKLNSILNSNRVSSKKKNSNNNNMLYSVDNPKDSFRKSSLKEVSENNETDVLLKKNNIGNNSKLAYLIEEKIKSSGRKSFEIPLLGDSIRKKLFKENFGEKSMKSSKVGEKLDDLQPYNNRYFFGLAKKLNVFKISGNKSLIKKGKKKENQSYLKEN